mgnify:CR=1 FL=1
MDVKKILSRYEQYCAQQKIRNKRAFKTIISNNKELQGEWQEYFLESVGLRMLYDGDDEEFITIEIKPLDTLRHATFSVDAPLADRIEMTMQDHLNIDIEGISKKLDIDADKIQNELQRDTRFEFNHQREKWENVAL